MPGLGRKLASFLWWTYPRGSVEYDVMVGIILAFIFLTPRHIFHDRPRDPHPAPALAVVQAAAPAWTLDSVLQQLTRVAPTIHAVAADAEVDDYTALVNDSSLSSGKLYFARPAQGPMYALDLTRPAASAKRLVYRDQTAYVYVPAARQVQVFALGNRQQLVNQYLLLGMGTTGADLTRSFQVRLAGASRLAGRSTVQLTLRPRATSMQGKLTQISLWYDTSTWIALQQQMDQPGGDYHRIRLSHVQVNPKIPNKVFSTKFPGATVVVEKP